MNIFKIFKMSDENKRIMDFRVGKRDWLDNPLPKPSWRRKPVQAFFWYFNFVLQHVRFVIEYF
jgi:hypothetical protein